MHYFRNTLNHKYNTAQSERILTHYTLGTGILIQGNFSICILGIITLDDAYSTVPFLASEDVPPNWAELVRVSE